MHDWRLAPLAVGAWFGAWAGTAGKPWTWAVAAAVGALVLALTVWRRLTALALGAGVLVVMALLTGILAWQRSTSALAELARARALVEIEVELVTEPRQLAANPPMPSTAAAEGQVIWVNGRGKRTKQQLPVLLTASGDPADALLRLRPGARVQLQARLSPTESSGAVVALVQMRELYEQVGMPGIFEQAASWLREGLRRAVARSPDAQRALVPSLVVGDQSRIDEERSEEFRATGLTHLMAVSGANLALMLGVILGVLRWVGVRGWFVRIVAVGGVAMFVLVCGPEPSVLRAAVMGLVALAATGVGPGRRSVRSLAVAVLALMALDPWLSRAPGFWLSFLACLGIVTFGPICIRALTAWAPRWLAEALAIPFAAQLFTQPVVTALNGEISLVGLLANVFAGPFVGPTTVLGFAAACTAWCLPASVVLGWLAGWCSQPILWIAQYGAGLPGATAEWIPGTLGVLLVTALCLAVAVLSPTILRRWWASLLVLVLVGCAAAVLPRPIGWPGQWQVAFCDVGQGDATVLRSGEKEAVLVDVGPETGPIFECLHALGVERVPMVVLTHSHFDHVGSFPALAARYPPSLVLTSAGEESSAAAAQIQASVPGAQVRSAVPGEVLQIGAVSWQTLGAWQPDPVAFVEKEGESSVENDSSVVGIAEVDGLRVLLPGDVEPEGQAAALRVARQRGLRFDAHVLKLPHHGSAHQDPRFFAATGASLAIASAGKDNSYGHPAQSALSLAREHGMAIARTDEDGTIVLAWDGKLYVRTMR